MLNGVHGHTSLGRIHGLHIIDFLADVVRAAPGGAQEHHVHLVSKLGCHLHEISCYKLNMFFNIVNLSIVPSQFDLFFININSNDFASIDCKLYDIAPSSTESIQHSEALTTVS